MISIVVPAYNAAGVIERCIDTVLRQTYPDFELLIIDDGSTDETAEIVAAKAAQDARIHLIRQENAGVSSARNTGIAVASGELLCFIDSDDTVSANYLETLLALYSPGVLPVIDVVRSDRNGSALSPMPETFMLEGDWVETLPSGEQVPVHAGPGETLEEAAARAKSAIDEITPLLKDGHNVLLVAHAHILRILTSQWLGVDPHFARLLRLDTAHYSVLSVYKGDNVIERWNA